MAIVDKKLDMIVKAMALQNISPSQQDAPLPVCAICSQFDHTTDTCPLYSPADKEQANYVGQYPSKNNPYSNPTIQDGETTPTSPGVIIRML